MSALKAIHVLCAYATGVGFLLRGVLAVAQHPLGKHRAAKILPHIIDTCLLVSGFIMFYMWASPLSDHSWLLAKLIALLIYIGFGLLMLRWGTNSRKRWLGLIGGLIVYLYIIGAAHSKAITSFFSVL